MLYGQWWGHIRGSNNAYVIMSIDKLKENREGNVTIEPNDDHTFQNIARIVFDSVNTSTGQIEGHLDQFIGFRNGKIVLPGMTTDFAQSGSGNFEGKLQNSGTTFLGKWKTNLGFSGDVKFHKVARPRAHPVEEIISWEEFKKRVVKYQGRCEDYCFRGQNDSLRPLTTRFHRSGCWDLYRFYKEKLPELFDYLGVLNKTRYAVNNVYDFGPALLLAQHYGFPTPLLDWTLSPYIAAYFAFRLKGWETIKDKKSVRIFVFHAKRWNDEQPRRVKGEFIAPGITVKPLNIPLAGNTRAIAQRSRSVFSNIENLENVLQWAEFEASNDDRGMPLPYLDYYDVNIDDKNKALQDLKAMNIMERVLFPELDTICKELSKEYFQEYLAK